RYRRIDRPLELGQDRTHAGPTAQRAQRIFGPTRHALKGVVIVFCSDHGANDGELVHHGRYLREYFADLNARHASRDGLELAADFLGSVGLDLPHILMRRAASKEDVDDGLVRTPRARAAFGTKDVRERQSAGTEAQHPDFEEAAARNPVAHSTAL